MFPVPAAFCVKRIVKVVAEFLLTGIFLNDTIPTGPFVKLWVKTVDFKASHSKIILFCPGIPIVLPTDTDSNTPVS